jgi:hypothetical protein
MSTSPTPVHHLPGERRLPAVLGSLLALILAAVVVALLVDHHSSTTIVGSGVPATQARSVPAFTSIDVNGISNLNLRIGGRQSVIVRADDNIVGRVVTRVVSGRLVIGTKPGSYSVKTPIVARVVVPSVAALTLNGVGDMVADGIDSDALTLSLNGLGSIRANGMATQLRVVINGDGKAQLAALRARDATVIVDGAGDVTLTATGSLRAVVNGNGAISYLGHPVHVTSSVNGSGEISAG